MVSKKLLKYYVFIGFLLFTSLSSCGTKYQASKAQRQAEKQMERRRKEGERAMRQARNRHLQAQSRETRKRMQETRRKSESLNNTRKKPFYIRWIDAVRNRR